MDKLIISRCNWSTFTKSIDIDIKRVESGISVRGERSLTLASAHAWLAEASYLSFTRSYGYSALWLTECRVNNLQFIYSNDFDKYIIYPS